MIRSILFDLDGTLLDTLDDLANSVNYALRTHHLPERSHTEIRSFLGNGIRNLMLDAVGRGMSDEAFEPVFQTFRTYYVEHCLDKSKPFAGIIDLLKALHQRGITLAEESNKLHRSCGTQRTFFQGLHHFGCGRKCHGSAQTQPRRRTCRPQRIGMQQRRGRIGGRLRCRRAHSPKCRQAVYAGVVGFSRRRLFA